MSTAQVALVTGTSTGIGRNMAETLARRGYVVFAGMRDPGGKNRAARDEIEALAAEGLSIAPVALDVTDDASVDAAVAQALERAGRIDVVVNNAGVGVAGLTECSTIDQVRYLYETNLFGVQRVCRAVLPHMRARRAGTLVFVSSMGGRTLLPSTAHYCGAKAALEMLADGYRHDLASFGIGVVVLQAGLVRSRIFHNMAMNDDEGRAVEYGPLAGVARLGIEGAIAMGGPDPQGLSDVLAGLLETPRDQRPTRTTFGADAAIVGPVNAAADEAERALRAMYGG